MRVRSHGDRRSRRLLAAAAARHGRAAGRGRRRGAGRVDPARPAGDGRGDRRGASGTGEHLLVQAGTGTGKSLAYLVPALTRRRPGGGLHGDAGAAVPAGRPRPAPAGRRGRAAARPAARPSRCSRAATTTCAWPSWRHSNEEEPDDALFDDAGGRGGGTKWLGEAGRLGKQIQRLRDWAEETETGDRDELDPGVDDTAWRQVSMPARECVGAARCPFGAGVLRRGVPGPRPRGRHRGHQPQPARGRHARRPPHRPAAQAARSSTRRTSWPTGSPPRRRPS